MESECFPSKKSQKDCRFAPRASWQQLSSGVDRLELIIHPKAGVPRHNAILVQHRLVCSSAPQVQRSQKGTPRRLCQLIHKRWPNIFSGIKNNFPDMPLLIPCSKQNWNQSGERVTTTKSMRWAAIGPLIQWSEILQISYKFPC